MKDFASKYVDMYDSMPLWAKVLLCFLWAIPSGLYRFSKSALADSEAGMALAIVFTLIFGEILFLIDIITLLICGKILWFNNPKKAKTEKHKKNKKEKNQD